MIGTSEKPTAVGWYWFRANATTPAWLAAKPVGIVQILGFDLRPSEPDVVCLHGAHHHLADVDGDWAGPIEMPDGWRKESNGNNTLA